MVNVECVDAAVLERKILVLVSSNNASNKGVDEKREYGADVAEDLDLTVRGVNVVL